MKVHTLLLFALSCGGLLAETNATPPEEIVQNYCSASRDQGRSLDGSSMEVEIRASLPKLKKHGRLHALRRISVLGRITYEHLAFEGDGAVKNQVIARYLESEIEAQKAPAPSLAVTPDNYKFKYAGRTEIDGREAYVFNVKPRTRRAGLYQGSLWIDATTFLRVKESGYLVKNPSIFLKRVAFTRKYEIRDGIPVPRQVASIVDTRIWGQAELEIDYSNFSVDAPEPAGAARIGGQ
ncbi:MAG TPA: hypothetical protein VLY24_23915 [Bryobacteraceae bacterium]|nr:hypothetical protein [Bryobacteraceae bacterium]